MPTIVGQLLTDRGFESGALTFERGRITAVTVDRHHTHSDDEPTVLVTPGLIDLQLNGAFGVEVGGEAQAYEVLAKKLPSTGVTAYLPTLVSSTLPEYLAAFDAFERAGRPRGAVGLGFHLEGPYLAADKVGAHRADVVASAGTIALEQLLDRGHVKLMTLAPELPSAIERINALCRRHVLVSLGHSNASYEQAMTAVSAGARMVTHLFNAMTKFEPRAPGLIGAGLADDRLSASLIADGAHSHPAAVKLALRAKGTSRTCLVTDAVAAAGMPPGDYQLATLTVRSDGQTARLADGTLAGSTLTMNQAIRNAMGMAELEFASAVRMASAVPASLLGLAAKGRLSPGADADLVVWSDRHEVLATFVGGELVYGQLP